MPRIASPPRLPFAVFVSGLALTCATATRAEDKTMKIRIDLDQTSITATLDDTETARDFVSLLPLTLTLEDYAHTEKISGLPRRLSTQGAPSGSDPSVGTLAYYAPWGNLALFYEDFGYSTGLIRLGALDGGVEAFTGEGPVQVRIQSVGDAP